MNLIRIICLFLFWSIANYSHAQAPVFDSAQVANMTIVANVEAGFYPEALKVSLRCAVAGAKIYYTTDGNPPSGSSSKYEQAIPVNKTMVLKAVAIKDGEKGEQALEFFKKSLIDPFARGINELNTARQNSGVDYKKLLTEWNKRELL